MALLFRRSTIALGVVCLLQLAAAQSPTEKDEPVRVRMVVNPDGSRTTYKFNDAHHKCIAETTNEEGKLREQIRYELDKAGRFSSGRSFGPDRKLRFKSRYKYNSAGRMEEETQISEQGAVLHRIVYSYDQNGRGTGYSVFDGNGKLVNRVVAPTQIVPSKARSKR
jgi:hypothetical protein